MSDNRITIFQKIRDIETDEVKRKHLRRFLNTMITLSTVSSLTLIALIISPLPKFLANLYVAKFLLIELNFFFPYTTLVAINMSVLNINKKSNTGFIIRILIYLTSLMIMAALSVALISHIAGK